MLSKVQSGLTFANVTSLLALTIALGGTAYAVTSLQPEAVKSRHIARGAIQPRHLSAGVIDPMKIGRHTVFSPLSSKPRKAHASAYGEVQEVYTTPVTSSEDYETTTIEARCRQTADSGKFTVTPSTTAAPNPVLHLAGAYDAPAGDYWNTTTVSSKNTDADGEGVTISVSSRKGGGTAWVHLYCTNVKP